jgi:hypothetical protein
MRACLLLFLLVFLISPANMWPQLVTSKPEPPREIELSLLPMDLVDGVPQGFTFVLTNVSSGDLRIPPPDIDCSNRTRHGAIRLQDSWTPLASQGLGLGTGVISCGGGGVYPVPQLTLLELTRNWTVLRPGESLRITADSNSLRHKPSSQSSPGTYTVSAMYIPPQLSSEAQRLLFQAGFVIPQQNAVTSEQHYEKP